MRGAGGNQFATSPCLFVSTMRNCGGKRPVSSTALIRRDFHPPSTALNLSPLSLSLSPLHVATLRYPKLEYHHKGIYLATIFPNERKCIDSALAPLFVFPLLSLFVRKILTRISLLPFYSILPMEEKERVEQLNFLILESY